MKTVQARLTVRVTVEMPEDAVVEDVLNDLDYNFYAYQEDGTRVVDSNIIEMNYEVKD